MPRKKRLSSASAPAPERAQRILALSALCTEAGEHMARARVALHADTTDTDDALTHLDEAIGCLKRLLSHSRSSGRDSLRARLRSLDADFAPPRSCFETRPFKRSLSMRPSS